MKIPVWSLILALGASVAACTTSSATPSNGTPDGGTSASGTTCVGVLQCAGNCADTDEACIQGCIDHASPSSRPIATALRQCIGNNACTDADCLNAKCKTELDSCLGDQPEQQGTPPTGTTPTGSVPASLVGTWSSVGLTTGVSWTFEADGQTTTAYSNETSIASCTYRTEVASSGVTTAGPDTYVYHRTSGTQTFKQCTNVKSSPMGVADLKYRYVLSTYEDNTPKLTIYFIEENGTVSTYGTDMHR